MPRETLGFHYQIEAFGREIEVSFDGSLLISDIDADEAMRIVNALEKNDMGTLRALAGKEDGE